MYVMALFVRLFLSSIIKEQLPQWHIELKVRILLFCARIGLRIMIYRVVV